VAQLVFLLADNCVQDQEEVDHGRAKEEQGSSLASDGHRDTWRKRRKSSHIREQVKERARRGQREMENRDDGEKKWEKRRGKG
jgi:hypothetical protein